MSQEDDNLSDSGHNSMSSLPPYRPPFRPHLSHIRSAAALLSQLYFIFKRSVGKIDFFILNHCVGSHDGRDLNVLRGFFWYPSASMGHINTIGSLDRTSLGPKAVGTGGVAIGEMACRSMATLSRLAPYGGEAPPPYEWTLSLSVEEVVSTGQMDGWMDGWMGG